MDAYWQAFFKLHRDIPREGPGSDAATRDALRRLPALPPAPRVLDLGCGPGRQTLVLACELDTPIVAVDTHAPYLVQLGQAAQVAGLADRVVPRQASFETLADEPGSIDLIWAEGSIFILGFQRGLTLWRPLLRSGGYLVVSEAAWLTEDPPAEAKAFWDECYPAITTVAGNVGIAAAAGCEAFGQFVLPQSGWWDEYYTPLPQRAERLREQAASDPALAQVLAEHDREVDVCRRFGDSFGYVFYLMRKAG